MSSSSGRSGPGAWKQSRGSDDRTGSLSRPASAVPGCPPSRALKTVTAAPPEGQGIQGLHSLEVRWILPGRLEPAVAGWFGRFPSEMAARQDAYLLDPDLGGLSVKVRAGMALEVKVYHGCPGILDIAGRANGRIESWQKWSFPLSRPGQDGGGPAGWRVIGKRRRIARFWLASGQAVAALPGLAREPQCAAELTEIRVGGQGWWSLGFEATGPASLLRSALQATARQVFAHAPPGPVDLGMSCCQSYAQWLGRGWEWRETEAPPW